MLVLPKLLALIPIAQTILWAMLVFAVWTCRDVLVVRRARAHAMSMPLPHLRWKIAVLSSLAATLLVICVAGFLAA